MEEWFEPFEEYQKVSINWTTIIIIIIIEPKVHVM